MTAVGLDTDALLAYLRPRIPGLEGPLTLRQFPGGQSNPTFALETPGRRLVLRKKPGGELLPSAHQIEREYRILGALAGTGVPVPRVVLLCEDPTVVGAAFYVMDFLDGRIFHDPSLPDCAPAERAAIYDAAIDTLAELHGVDYVAAGLGDYGRPTGYVERQIARWTKQYAASKIDEIPSMDALMAWLPAHLPPDDETTIAHGDYRMGNLVFHPTEPRVVGVLDWELSTLGHPLSDVAYASLTHFMPQDVMQSTGAADALANMPGIPTTDAYLARYCERAGRPIPANFDFFLALNFFRGAAIMQGIAKRVQQGNAAASDAQMRGAMAPIYADLGWMIASR
jgi:aminoglycoside phosphotransferase (APT) family kinase protein